MSKLIVEMEMPNRCPCVLAVDNIGWFSPCFADHGIPSRTKDFDDCIEKGTRPDWCPIKGVLPETHGDLIDRDVSIQTFKCIEEAPYSAFDGQEAFYTPEDVVNTLLCQDVVIPAERTDGM